MDRSQKIDFLTRLVAGEASIKELEPLVPFGIIFKDGEGYRVNDKTLNEDEFIQFLRPYMDCKRQINGVPVIYGIVVE